LRTLRDKFSESRFKNLRVGGEWAHALYDRAIPSFISKYLKKWGGKVGTTYIPVGEGEKGGLHFHLIAPNGELYDPFRTRQQQKTPSSLLRSPEVRLVGKSETTVQTTKRCIQLTSLRQ
jgi:hypothetical protein